MLTSSCRRTSWRGFGERRSSQVVLTKVEVDDNGYEEEGVDLRLKIGEESCLKEEQSQIGGGGGFIPPVALQVEFCKLEPPSRNLISKASIKINLGKGQWTSHPKRDCWRVQSKSPWVNMVLRNEDVNYYLLGYPRFAFASVAAWEFEGWSIKNNKRMLQLISSFLDR